MAERKKLEGNRVEFILSTSEMIILQQIIDKISRDKSLTTLDEYKRAGAFCQLLDVDRPDGTYRIY